MKNLLFFIFGGLTVVPVQARIINVPSEFSTIQAGIDASISGDTVLVATGEYSENPVIQDRNILLTSAEGPTNTRINGHITMLGAEVDTTCILRGFRIKMTVPDPYRNPYSLIKVQAGAPIIWGNIIEDNTNEQWGAGIYLEDCWAIIRGNIIRNNWSLAYWGGGICATNWDTSVVEKVVIEGNIINGNRAGYLPDQGDAGGVDMGRGILRYNLIFGNKATRIIYRAEGGGIRAGGSRTSIYNNTIVNNAAFGQGGHGRGGGLYTTTLFDNDEGFVKNNIIAFNSNGGGVYGHITDSTHSVWNYNLVFGNDTADYVGIEPGPQDVRMDPMFIDTSSGDYHLLSNSPCIDAGDPNLPLDPDSTRSDIGAYYFDQSVDVDENGSATGPFQFALWQNYPNPFNGQTVISYYLNRESIVSLLVYSITGHLIQALANKETQGAGEHQYIWEGRDAYGEIVCTGVYFYELHVNEHRESKALILIK